MRKRKSTGPGRRIIAVDTNPDGPAYTIYSDDKAGRQEVYLRHLARSGNKPMATLRAGMSKSGVASWRRDDPEFRQREADAVYEASARYISKINHAALKGDVKSSMWLTEKLNPEEYGRNDTVQHTFTPPPRLARRSWSEIPTLDATEDEEGNYRDLPGDGDEPQQTPMDEPPQSSALVIRPLDS